MSLCEKCQSKGLPIYPVRYAVAPHDIGYSLPQWANKSELSNIKLSKYSQYTLRTMRKGYLYLLSEYKDKKDLHIAVYKVDEQGGFWPQDMTKEMEMLRFGCAVIGRDQTVPLSESITSCNNSSHSSANISFITLEKPELCEKAWLAFSEHKWSFATLEQYLYQEQLRNARMQQIKPKEWLSSPLSGNGVTPITQAAIGSTMDAIQLDRIHNKSSALASISSYFIKFPYLYQIAIGKEEPISRSELNKPFVYNKFSFTHRGTLTPWAADYKEKNSEIVSYISNLRSYSQVIYQKASSSQRNSTTSSGIMIALIDSIGITAELSSWGSHAIAAVKKVVNERQRENACFSGIKLLEETIKNGDFSENDNEFHKIMRRKNASYLKDIETYSSDTFIDKVVVTITSSHDIQPPTADELTVGQQVVDIVDKAKSVRGKAYEYRKNPNMYDLSGSYYYVGQSNEQLSVIFLHEDTSRLIERIESSYPIKHIGELNYAEKFNAIFASNVNDSKQTLERLRQELNVLEADFEQKFAIYKKQWHEKNNTARSGEKSWNKYKACLSDDYDKYQQEYAKFLTDSDSYLSALVSDVLTWTNCLKLKEKHPFSLAADDLERDSHNYMAFVNDVLMTLGMRADEDSSVGEFLVSLVEDKSLNAHNIVWGSVFSARQLDKVQQRNCVEVLLTLNKQDNEQVMSIDRLFDKLSTVLTFYDKPSLDDNLISGLSADIHKINDTIFTQNDEKDGYDIAKEFVSLLDSQRSGMFADNKESQITAQYINPIKENVAGHMLVLLKYLHKTSGKIGSEFAEAWFVAATPYTLSKTALKKLMASYQHFVGQLQRQISGNVNQLADKFAKGYTTLSSLTQKALSGKVVGRGLVGALLFYQILSIERILSNNRLKTQAQQSKENYALMIAGTSAISLSFRLVAVGGESSRITSSMLTQMKFFGNFFGFISGVGKSALIYEGWGENKTTLDRGLFVVSSTVEILSTVDLFLQLQNKSLVQVLDQFLFFMEKSLMTRLGAASLSLAFSRLIVGFVIIAINPWFSLGLFLIQLAIELMKDDDMQIWLKRCRFGLAQFALNNDYNHRYKSSEEEQKALKAIFDKFEKQLKDYYDEQHAQKVKEMNKVLSPQVGKTMHELFNMRW